MEKDQKDKKHDCADGICKLPEAEIPKALPKEGECAAESDAQMAAKTEEYLNNWKRALADYQNLQKEVAKERAEMAQYAIARAVERFLPVFDNFNVAMSHMPKSDDKTVVNWAVGVGFIQKQIEDALRDMGLTLIKTVGEKFDPSKHEAVGEESAVSGQQSGVIVKETQAGYEIDGKVIRPAKVIVSK